MRISVPAAALALGSSLALGALVAPTALAVPAATCPTLGVADLYGEFIEGDDTHTPDAEGAVAVGGNAVFSPFTVGSELTAEQIAKLPGGNALVVGGNLTGPVRVIKGNGIYGGTLTGIAEAHAGKIVHGPSPIDFAAEFAKLRAVSAELAKAGGGEVKPDGAKLTLTGTDTKLNSFVVSAELLQKAGDVYLKVPSGAVTVVTVTGDAYDQTKGRTTGFHLWDAKTNAYVHDDKNSSAEGGRIREKLLWNLPTATKVVKESGNAWPGSVLAPNAAFDLGSGGPVNGSVIAKSLTGKGGAETHHYPFTGCLPATTVVESTPPSVPTTPSPNGTPSGTPSTSGRPSPSGTPTPSGSGSPSAPAPGTPVPSPSAPGGGLAFTGASGLLPLTVGGVLVLGAGVGIAVAVRRRGARRA
ncbi:choice-of-anchor A domain-containing protein [Kitasatospora gansuensis]|uniref:Choice-of-anchor A domain-containing protein n=1 Tax=Kitasatospora gansuensis TaxID=258050 RepID=A0A7W7WH57_9ACTN|nr:choice-of-anchor A family protein [Kitasatospora gansuensis]MBB4946350.1 choice-of-anchor A domain-containing protein [Kitasatospora gansuensis]